MIIKARHHSVIVLSNARRFQHCFLLILFSTRIVSSFSLLRAAGRSEFMGFGEVFLCKRSKHKGYCRMSYESEPRCPQPFSAENQLLKDNCIKRTRQSFKCFLSIQLFLCVPFLPTLPFQF